MRVIWFILILLVGGFFVYTLLVNSGSISVYAKERIFSDTKENWVRCEATMDSLGSFFMVVKPVCVAIRNCNIGDKIVSQGLFTDYQGVVKMFDSKGVIGAKGYVVDVNFWNHALSPIPATEKIVVSGCTIDDTVVLKAYNNKGVQKDVRIVSVGLNY